MRRRGGTRGPYVSSFLTSMPTVAVLHPEFEHLLKSRTKLQDRVFRALAELGVRTGELAGFTVDEATELLRAFIMGWFFERHLKGAERDQDIASVVRAFRLMAAGAQHLAAETAPPLPPRTQTTR